MLGPTTPDCGLYGCEHPGWSFIDFIRFILDFLIRSLFPKKPYMVTKETIYGPGMITKNHASIYHKFSAIYCWF